MNYITTRVKLT